MHLSFVSGHRCSGWLVREKAYRLRLGRILASRRRVTGWSASAVAYRGESCEETYYPPSGGGYDMAMEVEEGEVEEEKMKEKMEEKKKANK